MEIAKNLRRSKRVEAKLQLEEVKEEEDQIAVAAPTSTKAKLNKKPPSSTKKTASSGQLVDNSSSSSNGKSKSTSTAGKSKKTAKTSRTSKSNGNLPKQDRKTTAKTVRTIRPEEYCPYRDVAIIHEEYHALLNQTNISRNNNKFYIIQLLRFDNSSQPFGLWTRWGRVGEPGQNDIKYFGNADAAISAFCKKFQDKTKNKWGDKPFVHHEGKYDLIEREFNSAEDDDEDETAADEEDVKTQSPVKKARVIKSTLEPRLQSLIKLIFNTKMMSETMESIGYDTRKMPLGKLTKETVQRGYAVLKDISNVLDNPHHHSTDALTELSSRFYTIIPHDFGRTRPPIINTPGMLKAKLEMVDSLGDIQIATSIMNKANELCENAQHPLDMYYSKLQNSISAIEKNGKEWLIIAEYLKNTHASTHSDYSLTILDIFSTDRQPERGIHNRYKHNEAAGHWLLWHGSRLSNFVGILSQGLRIAPPEAPCTGYMFGKGIYFADMVSKSANYCFTSKTSNTGLLLLCQVYLGKQVEMLRSDYNADKVVQTSKAHSTKGCGATFPDSSQMKHVEFDGIHVKVPCGKPKSNPKHGELLYNEYIVYNVDQVLMRYVVQCRFDYSH